MNFRWALLLSIGFHLLLFHAGEISFRAKEKHVVEIDITNMGHMGMTPNVLRRTAACAKAGCSSETMDQIRRRVKKSFRRPFLSAHRCRLPLLKNNPLLQYPTKIRIKNIRSARATAARTHCYRIPLNLLNLSDLGAILNRFYPEEARAQRREETVVLDLHIEADGRIKSVDAVSRPVGAGV